MFILNDSNVRRNIAAIAQFKKTIKLQLGSNRLAEIAIWDFSPPAPGLRAGARGCGVEEGPIL